jgi:hypothetical protein
VLEVWSQKEGRVAFQNTEMNIFNFDEGGWRVARGVQGSMFMFTIVK